MKTVLIWGGYGFIGGHLAEGLVRRGVAVIIATRRPARDIKVHAPDIEVVSLQADNFVLPRLIERAEVIYNLAGNPGAVASNRNPSLSLKESCEAQLEFLSACGEAGTVPHVVFASSRLVYGTVTDLPVTEQSMLDPRSHYAVHKICAEHYHRIAAAQGQITYCICRISNPYGPPGLFSGRWTGFIANLIERGSQGGALEIFGTGHQLRDYIQISDLSEALRLSGERTEARNQTFNIGYGESISILKAAEVISQMTGSPIRHTPWTEEYSRVESGDYIVDISKARRLLGFSPAIDFCTGVEEIIRLRETATIAVTA